MKISKSDTFKVLPPGKLQNQRQMLLDERESQRKKRMIQREKYEKENCGGYELIYPLVGYEDEFDIVSGVKPVPIGAPVDATSNLDSTLDDNGNPILRIETPWDVQ